MCCRNDRHSSAHSLKDHCRKRIWLGRRKHKYIEGGKKAPGIFHKPSERSYALQPEFSSEIPDIFFMLFLIVEYSADRNEMAILTVSGNAGCRFQKYVLPFLRGDASNHADQSFSFRHIERSLQFIQTGTKGFYRLNAVAEYHDSALSRVLVRKNILADCLRNADHPI